MTANRVRSIYSLAYFMELKTYGVNYNGRERRIVAARSRAAAARLIGATQTHMANFGSQTHNKQECEKAMSEPGVVWSQSYKYGSPFVRVLANASGEPCPPPANQSLKNHE